MARMTYHEAAAALGISLESARRTARKKRWAKLDSNDGLARVEVPDELLADSPEDSPEDRPKERPEVVSVLTRHIERIEAQLAEAQKRAADRDAIATERDVATAQVEALRAALAAAERNGDRWHREATRRSWWGLLRRAG
jgi:hypothetical protein